MDDVKRSYPLVFEHQGSHRRHSGEYKKFGERWGSIKTFFEICDEKIEKVKEVYQLYLNDYLQFLSYLIDKADAEEAEEKYMEQIRKLKK